MAFLLSTPMTPTNTCGYLIECYTEAGGWTPCTAPVPTEAQAKAQLEKLDHETHRVYWAFKK